MTTYAATRHGGAPINTASEVVNAHRRPAVHALLLSRYAGRRAGDRREQTRQAANNQTRIRLTPKGSRGQTLRSHNKTGDGNGRVRNAELFRVMWRTRWRCTCETLVQTWETLQANLYHATLYLTIVGVKSTLGSVYCLTAVDSLHCRKQPTSLLTVLPRLTYSPGASQACRLSFAVHLSLTVTFS